MTNGNGSVNGGNVNGSNRGISPSDQNRVGNPYAPNRNGNNSGNYGVVYGYPFYPFSYGWNSGWYGSSYGSNYNNTPNTGYGFGGGDSGNYENGSSNGQNTTNTEQVQQVTHQPVTTGTPSVTGASSSVTAQAQIANAVDKSPALVSANSSVMQAQSAYNDARERALAGLRTQPAYTQALSRRQDASKAVGSAKASTGGDLSPTNGQPSNAVVSAATAKLEAGDEVTKMEGQALATDPATSAAKGRLDQATADRDALRAQLAAQYQQSTHGG